MGRKAKYSKDLLNYAVVEYSMNHYGELKLKDLAQWADRNVSGLKGVRYYHFSRESEISRKIQELDEETRRNRELREKLINRKNSILKGTIDSFFSLDPSEQIQQIQETRKEYGKLLHEKYILEEERKNLREELQNVVNEKNKLQNSYFSLKKDVFFLKKIYEEYEAKGKLDEIGIGDDKISLMTMMSSLSESGNCCSIDQVISRFASEFMSDEQVQSKGFPDEEMDEAVDVMLSDEPRQDDGNEHE